MARCGNGSERAPAIRNPSRSKYVMAAILPGLRTPINAILALPGEQRPLTEASEYIRNTRTRWLALRRWFLAIQTETRHFLTMHKAQARK